MLNQNLLLTGDDGYNLTKSLRFRNSASAYLNRTGGTSTSRRIHTFSFWTKSSVIGGTRTVLSAGPDDSNREVIFIDSNKFTYQVKISNTFYDLETTQVFRDPAAWYHFVVAVDTTQATGSNRVKIYVNGSQITAFGTAVYPPQNADLFFDDSNGSVSYIGALRGYLGSFNYDGYLAEMYFVDGQALTPSSFGQTSATTGVWIPKKYTGTYGTNGFYLPFTDVATTSGSNAGLGKDFSGNGNYWTTNNISVTSGSTYDSMTDVPTLTSATAANYCVLNSLNQNSAITLSAGNLSFTASNNRFTTGTFAVTSGKWYWEFYPVAGGASGVGVGAILATTYVFGTAGFANGAGYTGVGYTSNGSKYISGTSSAYGATYGSGNVIGVALDLDSGTKTITFYKDNTSQGSINLPTSSEAWIVATDYSEAGTHSINFGQRPFSYTPPTGFVALNTFNLPTPTIGATASTTANKYMDVTTYTGTGSSLAVVNAGGFQPDFVWTKPRSTAVGHTLFDAIRGVTNYLQSNTTGAEGTAATSLTAFNSNGFTVSSDTSTGANGVTYVGWQWKANGSGSSNTQGSITSTVSANTTAGFSIVTYTGNNTSGATVGHGLGAKPAFIVVKKRTGTDGWGIYHTSLGATKTMELNTTGAEATSAIPWNNTEPTSSVIYLNGNNYANSSSFTYVMYCFAQVAGYSAFGSYTGNGSTDGSFIYTGFRPKFVMIKCSSSDQGGNAVWVMLDTARNTYNVTNNRLKADSSTAEDTSPWLDINSNGFKIRETSTSVNGSSATYIYMAFAETPTKFALAR